MGQGAWRLQPQTAKEAGDAPGLLAVLPPRRSPDAQKTATGPAPALGPQSQPPYLAVECTVSTLQAAGPHLLSLSPHTRTVSPHLQVGLGGSSPSRQVPCLNIPRRHGGGGWLPTSAAPQVPHRCHATGDTVGSASGVWSICLEHSLGRGWKSPGESVRAGGGGEVLKLCWAWDPAGPRPRAPAPTPHLGAPGRRRGAGATQSRSLLVQNKARSPRGI